MTEASTAFIFQHIPHNIDKSSIKTFLNTNGTFSLEYAIFDPQTVLIRMHAVPCGWFHKTKSMERGMAAIQQFATALGLHPDFHVIGVDNVPIAVELLQSKFSIGKTGPVFHCGGLLGIPADKAPPISTVDGFTDNILEILTNSAQF
ncbi:MAG: hypothetical protein ACFFAU_20600, partial [Candidatus Hodarchaeota archaeon]